MNIQKIKTVFKNNMFMLKLLYSVCPMKIWYNLFMTIWGASLNIISGIVLLRTVINEIQAQKSFIEIAVFMIVIFLFQILTNLSIKLYDNFYLPKTDIEIMRKFQKMFFEKVSQMDLECFETPEFYDRYIRANATLSLKANEVLRSVCDIVSCIFTVTMMSYIIFTIDPFLILFALIPFFYTLIFGNRLNKVNYKNYLETVPLNRENDYILRTFYLTDYAKEMRLTKVYNVLIKKYHIVKKRLRDLIKKYLPKFLFFDITGHISNNILMNSGSTLYAAYKTVISKTMLIGDFFVVSNSIGTVSHAISSFAGIFQNFNYNSLYIEDLRYFLEYEPKISLNEGGITINAKNAEIEIKNMYFKYISQSDYCLKDINLKINSGDKISIVGSNGAGKSTLVKLLMRLYEVEEGEILLNGVNIKNYNLDSYREIFGTVFQDFQILSLSSAENVLMREVKDEKDRETVVSALKNGGIYNKISTWENGIDSILTREFDDNGKILSGGETQKMAIARVFAKSCLIAIMDEPSSALDPVAEYNLYNTMMEVCKDKTVVFISHRLSSAVMADKVYFFENGRIAESGSHKELMKLNGKYADMFRKQAEKYIDGKVETCAD